MCGDNNEATPAAQTPPVQANNPIDLVPDEVVDDGASEHAGSIASSSASVASSVFEFRVENGRTYHKYKDGKYNIPNDESEQDRLGKPARNSSPSNKTLKLNWTDLQHNLFLLTFDNKLGLAPPNEPDSSVQRVLDIGTGTGIWAVEFGEDHPDAEVLGMDLSPSMPEFVPPNVKFEIDDLDEEWTYSRPFDYIHSRTMNSSINDWPLYLKKVFNHLTPGGYFELQEADLFPTSDDGTLKGDSPLMKCTDLMYEASVKFGRPFQQIPPLVRMMEDTGFVDVKLNRFKWPTNSWPKDPRYKELGIWANENLTSGLEGFCMAPFTRAHDWTREEVLVFLVDVRKNMNDRSIHAYWPLWSVYGRKPTEEEARAMES
ncbi:Secondary metabolism regulator LAE1 [Colletotrichum siamense]|uniref:Secondary metabolism regulator LAE1 n=1 Tax=Colletotrichum siamense TaxID=690259 RepID=A0A9P5EYX6_COLSI|nr:Secondary metabolism regulator LAE1 [Colletotrichum siamense]KAF4862030.1 Secondary metabolism regulator LAE1 [Colletotrichum siamense]